MATYTMTKYYDNFSALGNSVKTAISEFSGKKKDKITGKDIIVVLNSLNVKWTGKSISKAGNIEALEYRITIDCTPKDDVKTLPTMSQRTFIKPTTGTTSITRRRMPGLRGYEEIFDVE